MTHRLITYINQKPEVVGTLSIKQLASAVEYCKDMYYSDKKPVTDELYDIIEETLKLKDPQNVVFDYTGPRLVDPTMTKKLPHMSSMNKRKPKATTKNKGEWVEPWIENLIKASKLDEDKGIEDKGIMFSDKADGWSGVAHYTKKQLHLFTQNGTDITDMLPWINVPSFETVDNATKLSAEGLVVRGEIICSKADVKLLGGKSGRSMAGVLSPSEGHAEHIKRKSTDPDFIKRASSLKFVAFEIILPSKKTQKNFSVQFGLLKKMGFDVVWHKKFSDTTSLSVPLLAKWLKKRRAKGPYDIDGIIVAQNIRYKRVTKGNPDYAVAFKMPLDDQKAVTEIKYIKWQVSAFGRLKPVAYIVHTKIGEKTIKHPTAVNAKYVVDNGWGPGREITIIINGDVIPGIIEDENDKVEPQLPEQDYYWSDSHVDVYETVESDACRIAQMVRFFTKMDIGNLKTGTVAKLYKAGITTISKALAASVDDLLEADGIKKKLATKIYNNIVAGCTNADPVLVMGSTVCFGSGMGQQRIQLIHDMYPEMFLPSNLVDSTRPGLTVDMVLKVAGFQDTLATQFVNGLPRFMQFLADTPSLTLAGPATATDAKVDDGHPLFGKLVLFTGVGDKNYKGKIEGHGGSTTKNWSKKVDILVCKDPDAPPSEKMKKGRKAGVPILALDQFIVRYLTDEF